MSGNQVRMMMLFVFNYFIELIFFNAKVTEEQKTMLLQYVDQFKLILYGNTVASGNAERKRLWLALSHTLNAMTGPDKSVDGWKQYCNELKMAHKAKARNLRHERNLTGGGELNQNLQEFVRDLTPNEQCLERIMGCTVDGHEEVVEVGFPNLVAHDRGACAIIPRNESGTSTSHQLGPMRSPTRTHQSRGSTSSEQQVQNPSPQVEPGTSQHLGPMTSPIQSLLPNTASSYLSDGDTRQNLGPTSSQEQAQPHLPPLNFFPQVEPGTCQQLGHTVSPLSQFIKRNLTASNQKCEAVEAQVTSQKNLTPQLEDLAKFFKNVEKN